MVDKNAFGVNRSDFSKTQTLRRLKLADPFFASKMSFAKADIEQFLSNLKYIARYRVPTVENPLTAEEHQSLALRGIEVPAGKKQEYFDGLMKYSSTKSLFKTIVKPASKAFKALPLSPTPPKPIG